VSRYGPLALSGALWMLAVCYGAYQAFQEHVFRQSVAASPVAASAPAPAAPDAIRFNPAAIVTVLGFDAGGGRVNSAESLQLRASFVSSQGPSQALLAGAQGARFFQVGEQLPGGSVLRRIEVDHVVLWRNGREERLTLKPASRHLVSTSDAARLNTPGTPRYLRPPSPTPRETP